MTRKDCPQCGAKDVGYLSHGAFVDHNNASGNLCEFSGHSDNTVCLQAVEPATKTQKKWKPLTVGTYDSLGFSTSDRGGIDR